MPQVNAVTRWRVSCVVKCVVIATAGVALGASAPVYSVRSQVSSNVWRVACGVWRVACEV